MIPLKQKQQLKTETIKNFGEQWERYDDNDKGYYASTELLWDIGCGLIEAQDIQDKTVCEVGSGTGRIVRMLLRAGAGRVHAVEPSKAMKVLRHNTQDVADKINYIQTSGDQLPDLSCDLIVSIGVIHHIPDPDPVVKQIYHSLVEEGKCLIWLYGKEGNRIYLSIFKPLRAITTIMPDLFLVYFSKLLERFSLLYIRLAYTFRVPMRAYILNYYSKLSRKQRENIIFDQLNPAFAKYYTHREAIDLMKRNGFQNVSAKHRHNYSWSVIGIK